MAQFAYPEYLHILFVLIPLAGLFLFFWLWRKKALNRMGTSSLIQRLSPDMPTYKHPIKFGISMLALAFMILGFANLQTGKKDTEIEGAGIELFVAVDISRSMLAQDIKPNRLERARLFVSKLIDELSDDRIGIILFAGDAYLQCPLTPDYSAAKMYLKSIDTRIAPVQGTAIGKAIQMAQSSFQAEEKRHKALIIISDGEAHEGEAVSAVIEAAEKGTIVFTIGLGTPKGAPIPVPLRNGMIDYKKDKSGNIVLSKLNEDMLADIAKKGNGTYLNMSEASSDVSGILQALKSVEKKKLSARKMKDAKNQFQYFIAIALILLIINFFLSEKRSRTFSDWNIFQTKP